MKRQIRQSVFETNSSSMHSVTLCSGPLDDNQMYIEDGYIVVPAEEFGWGVSKHRDQLTKLAYLLMMIVETENPTDIKELHQTKGFNDLNDAIASYCNCNGISVADLKFETKFWTDKGGTKNYYTTHEGYIDHQSCEDYKNLDDFISNETNGILDFVFNPKVVLHIANDNM